jgi:hypothetical protein
MFEKSIKAPESRGGFEGCKSCEFSGARAVRLVLSAWRDRRRRLGRDLHRFSNFAPPARQEFSDKTFKGLNFFAVGLGFELCGPFAQEC